MGTAMKRRGIETVIFPSFVGIMLLIIGNNFYQNQYRKRVKTDILQAAKDGNLATIRSLLARHPDLCLVKDEIARTPLSYVMSARRQSSSLSAERREAALLLLKAGADPNAFADGPGHLLTAACQMGDVALVEALL